MSVLTKFNFQANLPKSVGFISTIVITTLIQARANLKGYYYGDPFDGRLMVVLHEHWWHFLRGRRDFLDTFFFYPFDRGLGFSDTFFLHGFFYSIARAFRFDLIDSWALATISVMVFSNIGVALLAKQTLNNFYLQLSLILVIGSSFTFFAFLNISPNVAGYGLVSFLAYFSSKFLKANSTALDKNIGFLGLSITYPILLLSAWYAAFFSGLFLLIYFAVHNFSNSISVKNDLTLSFSIFKTLNAWLRSISIIFFTLLTSLWIYIYLPVSGDVDRSVEELRAYSIKLDQLNNSAALGGGIFNKIYSFFGYTNPGELIQDQNGITITLFLSWLFLGIYFLTTAKKSSLGFNIDFKLWITLTLQFIFFLQIKNISLFQLTWELIPALKAIRVSSRMLILVAAVIIFLVHRILDKNLKKYSASKLLKLLAPLIILVIFMDQIRFETATWQKDNYISSNYYQSVGKAKQICAAFYLNSEGEEWWDDQLTAMVLSARLNFPTVNGYSGGYPDQFPAQEWRSRTQLVEVVRWLGERDALQDTCLIRPNSIDKLNTNFLYDSKSGFDIMERSGKNFWWWSKNPIAEFSIINLSKKDFYGDLEVTVEIPPCQSQQELLITNSKTTSSLRVELDKKRTKLILPISVVRQSESHVRFQALKETCQLDGDPRELYFSLKNPNIRN